MIENGLYVVFYANVSKASPEQVMRRKRSNNLMIDEQNYDYRYKAKPNCSIKAGQDPCNGWVFKEFPSVIKMDFKSMCYQCVQC
jgi:hypothetical protein